MTRNYKKQIGHLQVKSAVTFREIRRQTHGRDIATAIDAQHWRSSLISNSIDPIITRHDSFHELIEHGNSERRITMIGAPYHTLFDQGASRWRP